MSILGKLLERLVSSIVDKHGKEIFSTLFEKLAGSRPKNIAYIHFEAIHEMRRFFVAGIPWGEDGFRKEEFQIAYRSLADKFRDTMAGVLDEKPDLIHCTLKVCAASLKDRKEDWRVWTIGRSTTQFRRGEMGPQKSHIVGQNSSFAALVGCTDRENQGKHKWPDSPHLCFGVNDLSEHEYYDETMAEKVWQASYITTLVFPIRFKKEEHNPEHYFCGFLTFDSLKAGIFDLPTDIYDYKDDPHGYALSVANCSAYNTGCIIADVLALAIAFQQGFVRQVKADHKEDLRNLQDKEAKKESPKSSRQIRSVQGPGKTATPFIVDTPGKKSNREDSEIKPAEN